MAELLHRVWACGASNSVMAELMRISKHLSNCFKLLPLPRNPPSHIHLLFCSFLLKLFDLFSFLIVSRVTAHTESGRRYINPIYGLTDCNTSIHIDRFTLEASCTFSLCNGLFCQPCLRYEIETFLHPLDDLVFYFDISASLR
jgi:hypothetical protein